MSYIINLFGGSLVNSFYSVNILLKFQTPVYVAIFEVWAHSGFMELTERLFRNM